MVKKRFVGIVIPHTHWDRAWYLPFEQFRIQLVDVAEKLLRIMRSDSHFKFTFDGQTIVLEDILEIHPEWETELKKYIGEGRIMVGPWYVQADEFLASGEALIRNLLIGHCIGERFGRVMKVGYSPDPFGHIAQMPQILNGFGIDTFVFMRGMGNEGEGLGQEFFWMAPDKKSKVLAYHQVSTYVNAAYLGRRSEDNADHIDLEAAKTKIARARSFMEPHQVGSVLYFSNGTDHAEPQEEIGRVIKALNKDKEGDIFFVLGTPEDFFRLVEQSNHPPKEYQGELRSGRFDWHLPGVISTRLYLKQENFQAQQLLERWVEPFSALAHATLGSPDRSSHIEYAWRTLLKNHPHDDICGCGIDEMHREAQTRFARVRQTGEYLRNEALHVIATRIARSPSSLPENALRFAVFNPLSWERKDAITVSMPFALWQQGGTFQDVQNQIVQAQFLRNEGDAAYILIQPTHVPSIGYTCVYFNPAQKEIENNFTHVRGENYSIENEFLFVRANANGTVDITDKVSGKTYMGLGALEDTEDAGDEYDYSPLERSETIDTIHPASSIEVVEKGPVRAKLHIQLYMFLPAELDRANKKRSVNRVACPAHLYISLIAGIPRVDFELVFENKAKDHRLRAVFPSDIQADTVHVEEHFHVIERSINMPDGTNWAQKPVPTQHQESFISVEDGEYGFSILNAGLPEYEVKSEEKGITVYLTLLRGVGELSRTDLLTRPGGAGPSNILTPDAQCVGTHTFRYAFAPLTVREAGNAVMRLAHEYNASLYTVKVPLHPQQDEITLPQVQSFIALEPPELVLTAIKQSRDRNSLIVRFYCASPQAVRGTIRLWQKPQHVYRVNLNEERQEEFVCGEDGSIAVSVLSWEIITLECVFDLRS